MVIRNYATDTTTRANSLVFAVLEFCDAWRTPREIELALGVISPASVLKLVRRLTRQSLLERSDRLQDPRERAMSALDRWNPEAGFFHTATKNVRFWSPQEAVRHARRQAREQRMPATLKRYPGAPRVDLPKPGDSAFARVALERRTWRRFSSTPMSLDDLATILGLSAGVQKWVHIGDRDVPLKTSPSGGARHPVEAYVVARDVRGLDPGTYHYVGDRHALERLRRGVSAKQIRAYVPHRG